MSTENPTATTAVLTPDQRDVLWTLAVEDLAVIGDIFKMADRTRDLGQVHDRADTARVLLDLFDAIGWTVRDDRDTYPVDLAASAGLLRRWRDQLDGAMRDQTDGDEPLSRDDLDQVDADLDARHVLDQLLAEVTR